MEPGVRHEVVRVEWPPTLRAIGPRVTSSLLPVVACCFPLLLQLVGEREDAGAEIERSPYPLYTVLLLLYVRRTPPLRLAV